MFVGERLIYVQLQKTACNHITALLTRFANGKETKRHDLLKDYDSEKYIAGSVRNPWKWYVSLWAFGCMGYGLFHELVCRREHVPDAKMWQRTYIDHENPECFRKWLKMVFGDRTRNDYFRGEGYSHLPQCFPLNKQPLTDLLGLYSFRYLRMHCRNRDDLMDGDKFTTMAQLRRFDRDNNFLDGVIRTEQLEDDLIRVLREAGYPLKDPQIEIVRNESSNKRNKSRHKPANFYYDDETIDLVKRHDQFIIGKYAYKFPAAK